MTPERTRALPARYYTDPDLFTRELDAVFARTWQLVGHRSQVAEPGDLLTVQVGDERVIVANDDGRIGAFYNVCQHRGHPLVTEDQIRGARAITCPYHAWT
ncbi:MAG: Rieske 2Fe-2S domain-containing protein [Actinomycetota bacterium]